tara:strand:+ start:52 stop:1122 length:1071 start_codon:yes stop_codon:yes gene_type:complete
MQPPSPVAGFVSGSDNDDEYNILDIDVPPQSSLPTNETTNPNDHTLLLYHTICDAVTTQMDLAGLKRALMLEYSIIRPFLVPFQKAIDAFRPKMLRSTLKFCDILSNAPITHLMFEKMLIDIELGKDQEPESQLQLHHRHHQRQENDQTTPTPPTQQDLGSFRDERNQSVLSWVTTDDEEDEDNAEEKAEPENSRDLDNSGNYENPEEDGLDLSLSAATPPPLLPELAMTPDEEALAKAVVDIVDARLKAGFEERDRAIIAVESTLTSFLEILQNQEEQEEELELMFTERGHPLVPARAFTPGPIPTPPPQKDFKRKTRKKQRRFGPQIFQKPKPVILGISQGKSASSAGVCLLVC